MSALPEASATELLRLYESGATSPSEVVAACLERVERLRPVLNNVIEVLDERALAAASESTGRWSRGEARPLEGVPFGVKDVFDIAGVRTTAGSKTRLTHRASVTATVVRRLEEAGAIPLTKDATTEWAVGGPQNPAFGTTRNPWDTDRWTGGSSTGSAAGLAARLFPIAVASDAGGSIRVPSSWCGVTGLKPTQALVSRHGAVPLSWTMETVGPIARSADDVALALGVIAGPDPLDPLTLLVEHPGGYDGSPDLEGLRVGVPWDWFARGYDGAVLAAFRAFLAELAGAGCSLIDVSIPSAEVAHTIGYQLVFVEAASVHECNRERFGDYDPVAVQRMSAGLLTSAQDYLRMLKFRHELQREFEAAFALADVVVTPGTPSTAARLSDLTIEIDGERVPLYNAHRSAIVCNLAGVPGLVVPTGIGNDGLPVSAQIVAPPLGEARCLAIARRFQQRTEHHLAMPAGLETRSLGGLVR